MEVADIVKVTVGEVFEDPGLVLPMQWIRRFHSGPPYRYLLMVCLPTTALMKVLELCSRGLEWLSR